MRKKVRSENKGDKKMFEQTSSTLEDHLTCNISNLTLTTETEKVC